MNYPHALAQRQGGFFKRLPLSCLTGARLSRTFAGLQTGVDLPLHVVQRFPDLILRPFDSPPVLIPELMGKGRVRDGLPSSHAMNTSSFIQVIRLFCYAARNCPFRVAEGGTSRPRHC